MEGKNLNQSVYYKISIPIKRRNPTFFCLTILQGLKYNGSRSSGLESGFLYATSKYGYFKRPRYDFIAINVSVGETEEVRYAMLLCLIEKQYSDERLQNRYYAIVQYLHVIKPNLIFPELLWASGTTTRFDIDVIQIESILLPAMIVPQFHIPFDPESPKVTDRFSLVPRQFSDKSGWLDLNHVVYNNKSGNLSSFIMICVRLSVFNLIILNLMIGLSLDGMDYAQYLLRHANINIFAYTFDDEEKEEDDEDDISDLDDGTDGDNRYEDEDDEGL